MKLFFYISADFIHNSIKDSNKDDTAIYRLEPKNHWCEAS